MSDCFTMMKGYNLLTSMEEDDLLTKIERSLECPICMTIPRDTPIPACVAGHIVCKPCKMKIDKCPICRREFGENTSTLASSQIALMEHKCKYSVFGCKARMSLEKIVEHEKTCSDRTVTCPYDVCRKEVHMKMFHQHAISQACSLNLAYGTSRRMGSYLYPLSSDYLKDWDGSSTLTQDEFDLTENKVYQFASFEVHDKVFFLSASYLAAKKTFFFYVMLPKELKDPTLKHYSVKLSIRSKDSIRKLLFEGPVLSIEDIPDVSDPRAFHNFWAVHYEAIRPFFEIKDKNHDDEEKGDQVWVVKLPVNVEVIKESSRKNSNH